MNQFSPEIRFLILIARFTLGARERASIQDILDDGIDWAKVITYAERFGVQPLLYWHIKHNAGEIPADVFGVLEKAYRLQAMKNMRLEGCLQQIVQKMNKNDIPVILLKGAFFAAHLYPDASLRPMSDIDLLFKSEDIHRARDLIISLGYSQTPGGARQSPLHERISLLQGEHLPSLEKAGITRIEMHSNISGQDAASVWLRSIHHTMDGLHFYSLSPEHQILYCCAHLRHHIRQGSLTFYWLCDIHEILRKYERDMDWDFVFRSASTTGIDVAVLSTLAFMKKEWHSPTPEILAETEELDIFKGLDDPWKEVKLTVPDYYEKLKLVRHAGDWNERFLYLRGLVFPSRTFMLDTYQPKDFLSLCLCYAIHPFTRIRRIAVSLFFNTLSIVKRSV